MTEEFIPYGKQFIDNKDIDAVIKVLKGEFLTQGPHIELFEKEICKKTNSSYSVAVNSATSALHLSCLALDLKSGDELWTSPISFVASANCGRYCGAKVNFVDIDPNTGLMSIEDLEKRLKLADKCKKLPKILIPVHLSGASCNMKKIHQLSLKYGFHIIEDASHSIGAKYNDSMVGSCIYSDITVFSFHPVKIITTGEGGIATTNNLNIFKKLKKLRSHGITKDKTEFQNSYKGSWFYEQQDLGFNYRMNDISAALGVSQLKKLEFFIQKRRDNANLYASLLKNLPGKILNLEQEKNSSHHLTIFQLDKEISNLHYLFVEYLRDNGIGVQIHYIPIHLQPYYKNLGFSEGQFPNAELFASSSFSIPNYVSLKKSELIKICDNLKSFLRQRT